MNTNSTPSQPNTGSYGFVNNTSASAEFLVVLFTAIKVESDAFALSNPAASAELREPYRAAADRLTAAVLGGTPEGFGVTATPEFLLELGQAIKREGEEFWLAPQFAAERLNDAAMGTDD